MPPPPAPVYPPAPVSSPAPMFIARPRLSMSRTAKGKKESPSPARSASGLRTYGPSPSSGERTPQLPGRTDLDDAVDYEARDSEGEERTAMKGTVWGTELDGVQALPPQLPEAWTSLSVEAQAALIRCWSDIPGLGVGATAQCSTPAQADAAAVERSIAVADDHPDVDAAERALTAAETLGAASAATARRRAQELTVAEHETSAVARTGADATTASGTANSASKAAAVTSEDAALSASPAQDSISRAREALWAARADSSTKLRRVAEARTLGKRLLQAEAATTATPAPGLSPSATLPPSAIAVDARIKRTGDMDFFQESVACMAAGPNSCFPLDAAARVVSAARQLRLDMPADDLSVHDA